MTKFPFSAVFSSGLNWIDVDTALQKGTSRQRTSTRLNGLLMLNNSINIYVTGNLLVIWELITFYHAFLGNTKHCSDNNDNHT